MDILQYLIALLKIRKEIGIEGLGTLYKKKTPGRYNAETHSFLPPSYVLQFTTDLTERLNLVQYIQTKRSISEESAKYFIQQFVAGLKNDLQQNGQVTLENFGSFKVENETLTFTPAHNINIGFDFFALPAVTAAPIVQEEETITEKPTETESKSFEVPQIEQVEDTETDIEVDETEEESDAQKDPNTEEEINQHQPQIEQDTENNQETEELAQQPSEETTAITEALEQSQETTDEEESDQPLSTDGQVVEIVEEQEAISVHQNEEHKPELVETHESKSFEDNEATQEDVCEEINEVNAENPTNIDNQTRKVDEIETWDFDDEHVVSEDDIKEEQFNASELAHENLAGNQRASNFDQKPEDGIKLNATTQSWDFDNAATHVKDEEQLIGAFDEEEQQEPVEDERTGMPFFQKLIIALLVLLVVGAVAYYYNPEILNNFNRNDTNPDQKIALPIENKNLKTQQDSLSFADSIMKNAEKVGLEVEPAKDTLKVTTKTSPINTTTYEIISAAISAKRKNEVEQYIASMKRKGFDAKIVKNMPGKIYTKISIASYTNIDSATKDLKKLRLKLKNKDLYIFEDKNK